MAKTFKPKNAEERIWDDFLQRRSQCCGVDCCKGVINGLIDETTGVKKQIAVDNGSLVIRDQP